MGIRSTKKTVTLGQKILDGKGLKFFSSRRIDRKTNPTLFVNGLAGKFFNGSSWRSTISTGNIGTLPLTTTNDSSNVTGTTNLPSANHRYGVNLWTSIAYGDGLGDNYGFIAIGYFTPPTTGTYTFYTSSDDGSGVWIGELALEGASRTSTNAVVNNGLGSGQGNTKRSGTISLTGGVRYPIRIVHEEGAGGDNLTFSWSGPSITETTSLSTYFSTPVTEEGQITGNYLSSASSLVLDLDAGNSSSYPGSGTTWTDLSGYLNNGTLTNGPTYSSSDGGSIVFDGSNDYVQGSGSVTTNTMTFLVWIKRNGNQPSYSGLIYTRTSGICGLHFLSTTNKIAYTWNNAEYNWDSGLTVPNLTWCMCVISISSTSATAYLCQSSGITSATNSVSHSSITVSSPIIGRDPYDDFRFYNGNIAKVSIYNRALSAAEVQQNFDALRGRYGI